MSNRKKKKMIGRFSVVQVAAYSKKGGWRPFVVSYSYYKSSIENQKQLLLRHRIPRLLRPSIFSVTKLKWHLWISYRTFLVNYGSPLEEKFSLLVILVMCIGLGLPALLVIGGGTFMFAKKIRRNKDELSLER